MDCKQAESEQIAERYLHGELGDVEREAYEQHFFACSRCYQELRTYWAIQVTLQQTPGAVPLAPVKAKTAWRWMWVPAGALAILILSLAVWFRQPATGVPASPPEGAVVQPSPAQPPPAAVSLTELARIEPPRYTPTTLRSATDDADKRFRGAMKHYLQGDYASALRGLRAASELNPQAPNIAFFLGVCHLLVGQTDAGIVQLRRTIALGDSPFLEEAHFYLAKAYLRENNLSAAQEELRKALLLKGDLQKQIQNLLGQLQRLTQVPR